MEHLIIIFMLCFGSPDSCEMSHKEYVIGAWEIKEKHLTLKAGELCFRIQDEHHNNVSIHPVKSSYCKDTNHDD